MTNGDQRDTRRRYLSFTRGRLSERTTPIIPYDDFDKWLRDIEAHLNNDPQWGRLAGSLCKTSSIYRRRNARAIFSLISPPKRSTPLRCHRWVSPERMMTFGWSRMGVFMERSTSNVLKLVSRSIRKLDVSKSTRISLMRSTLDTADGRRRIFTNYLNESQDFGSFLDSSVMYTQGRFFTPNLRPWRGGGTRINIEKIVVGCAGLKGITPKREITVARVRPLDLAHRRRTKVFHDVGWDPRNPCLQ